MKIILSAETTVDTPKETLAKLEIPFIPFHLEKDGQTYYDNETSLAELFEFTERTGKMCHTSAPNVQEYLDYFGKLLEDKDAVIIHFTISSKLSSSYSNAIVAAKDNERIKVVDTRGTSGTIGLLIQYAAEMRENGYSPEEIYESCMKRRKYSSTSFIIKDLKYLYKGGRCSGLKYFATKVFKIRPVICTAEDGSFKVGKTYRGDMEACTYKYVRDRLDAYNNLDLKRAYINPSTYTMSVIENVTKILKDYGFEEVVFGPASPVNAYHAGPDVTGIQFFFDGPHPVTPKIK